MDQSSATPAAAPTAKSRTFIQTAQDVKHKITVEGLTQVQVAAEYGKSTKCDGVGTLIRGSSVKRQKDLDPHAVDFLGVVISC
jgi:hypothetical protein